MAPNSSGRGRTRKARRTAQSTTPEEIVQFTVSGRVDWNSAESNVDVSMRSVPGADAFRTTNTGTGLLFRLTFTSLDLEDYFTRHPSSSRKLYFQVHHKGSLIGDTSKTISWDPESHAERGGEPVVIPVKVPARLFTIGGTVYEKGRAKQDAKLAVRAFNVGLGKEDLLTEVAVAANGTYRLSFTSSQLRTEQHTPDVIVRVFDSGGKDAIAESPLHLALPETASVDIFVDSEPIRENAQFERVAGAVQPLLAGLSLDSIGPNEVALMARQTRLSGREILLYVHSLRHSQATGVAAETFFGLLEELPADLLSLLREGSSRWRTALERSIEANLVEPEQAEAMETVMAALEDQSVEKTLESRPAIVELMELSGLSSSQQRGFLLLWLRNEDSPRLFWESLVSGRTLSTEQVRSLQLSLQLLSVTFHLPIVRALPDIRAGRDLARLTTEQWQDLIAVHGAPVAIPGDTSAERQQNYLDVILRVVGDAFPTDIVFQQLARDPNVDTTDLERFYSNVPGLDLLRKRARVLAENPEALDGISDVERLRRDLDGIANIMRLAPASGRSSAVRALYFERGLSSSFAVQRFGIHRLLRIADQLGGEEAVRTLAARAAQTASIATFLFVTFSPQHNQAFPPGVFPVNPFDYEALLPDPRPEGLPDFETLFPGALDFCSCKHCRSVLSPAAYLVDLLQFTLKATDIQGRDGLQRLLDRRPDLAGIQLSCENTNTALPHVDLVLEILERIVEQDGTSIEGGPVPQTNATAEQLLLYPEHTRIASYSVMADARYPWILPFDLATAEADAYLKLLRLSDDALLRMRSPEPTSEEELIWATRYLSLTISQRNLITGEDPASLAALYGFFSQNSFEEALLEPDTPNVSTLLERSGLTLAELESLLESAFVNPEQAEIEYAPGSCDPETARIDFNGGDFDRLLRFWRLLQVGNFSIPELDRIVERTAGLGNAAIVILARVLRLKESFAKTRADIMLSWWGSLSTLQHESDPSPYDKVFLNLVTFPDPEDRAVFALNADRSELADTSRSLLNPDGTLNEAIAALISTALAVRGDRLRNLLPDLPDAALNLENLSGLHRLVTFMKALGIELEDLRTLQALSGLSPFASGMDTGTESTLRFLDAWQSIQRSGISLALADYILRHQGEALLDEEAIDRSLSVLRNDLAGIRNQNADAQVSDLAQLAELEARIRQASENAIWDRFSQDLALDARIAVILLQVLSRPDEPGVPALEVFLEDEFLNTALELEGLTIYPALRGVWEHAHKVALLVEDGRLDPEDVEFLFANGPGLGWLDLAALPLAAVDIPNAGHWQAFLRLLEAIRLNRFFPAGTSLFGFLSVQHESVEAALQEAAALLNWNLEDIQFLAGDQALNIALEDTRDERWLVRLESILELSRRSGTSASRIWSWTDLEEDDFAQRYARAQDIRHAAQAKVGDALWPKAAEPIGQDLRLLRRNSLEAYVLARFDTFSTSFDLYQHYLIDPDINPCFMTSRIRQAIAAVQLFIQRIWLNLEDGLAFPSEWERGVWEWMKNYRVWEANRKVFLYPENWLQPDFLDRKSPFLRELESELLQDEITLQNAERAYRNYLLKLENVARLEIAGMYQEGPRLHVFARTKGRAELYFYRVRELGGTWSAWSSVDVDIEGNHVVPVVYQNRLMLIWAVFEVETEQRSDEVESEETLPSFYKIRLKWSRYENGKWTPSQISRRVVSTECKINASKSPTKYFYVWAKNLNDAALYVIPTYFLGSYCPNTIVLDCFRFSGCTEDPEIVAHGYKIPYRVPFTGRNDSMKFSAQASRDLTMFVDGQISPQGALVTAEVTTAWLLNPQTRFSVLPPHQFPHYLQAQAPFFYEDRDRVFVFDPVNFVTPGSGFESAALVSGESISPAMPVVTQFQYLSVAGAGSSGVAPAANEDFLAPVAPIDQADCYAAVKPAVANEFYCISPVPILPPSEPESGDLSLATLTTATMGAVPTGEITKRFIGTTFYHPFACDFLAQANRAGLFGLLQPEPEEPVFRQLMSGHDFQFSEWYRTGNMNQNALLAPLPAEEVDFSLTGAYSQYNWELFFHIPVLMAERLKREQRFEEAQKWLHTIFNPSRPVGEGSQRYWMLKPFFEFTGVTALTELMRLINDGDPALAWQVHVWRYDAFNPHRIARMRPVAYMKSVVMQYIELLIAWGDSLFRLDTMESVQEAAQLYVMAALLLGEKPREAPEQEVPARTFAQIEEDLDAFSNALVQIETQVLPGFGLGVVLTPPPPHPDPSDTLTIGLLSYGSPVTGFSILPTPPDPPPLPGPAGYAATPDVTEPLQSVLYFCVPPNDKLLGYWDTVADRLFKIRNCMNLDGQVRSLALFEPPIDPALLIQAKAAGLSLASVLNDLFMPLPPYRFNLAVSKALEFCTEVKGLGQQLLSELEKRDGESLALLRAQQESRLTQEMIGLRKKAIEEAESQVEVLKEASRVTQVRLSHYTKLIEQEVNENEVDQRKVMEEMKSKQDKAGHWDRIAAIIRALPDANVAVGWKYDKPNIGFFFSIGISYGIDKISAAFTAVASKYHNEARKKGHESSELSFENSLSRRFEEWELQRDQAKQELQHIDRQVFAAQIRIDMATKELRHQERQIEQARETEVFLKGKYTNKELYNYSLEQVSSIYFQSYQLAYEMAKRAERCYRHELGIAGDAELLVRPGHWDSLKKGLLAGEKLQRQINRLQAAYLDQNRREYELSKSVSLASLDPEALLGLRSNGECFFQIPEELFDLDHPGHYFRRVKSVSLSIHCVTGPYTGVSATLTQLGSRIRTSVSLEPAYAWNGDLDDARFRFDVGGIQSIATSQGQADAGVFQLDFRDERFLPFEGSGAVSNWQLRLPETFRQFDYNTISDVLIHLQYTSREAGLILGQAAVDTLEEALNAMVLGENRTGLFRYFSIKSEFPNSLHQLLHPPVSQTTQESTFTLSPERFPFLFRHRTVEIDRIDLILLLADGLDMDSGSGAGFEIEHPSGTTVFSMLPIDGLLRAGENVGSSLGDWTLRVTSVPPSLQTDDGRLQAAAVRDIGLLIHYQVS